MNTKITIGQYYPVESRIHKLDSRLKILSILLLVVLLFFVNNFIGYGIIFVFLFLIIKLSNVPFRLVLKSLKNILFVIIFTFVLNIFLSSGEKIIFQYGFLRITEEGFILGIKMSLRLCILVMVSSALTLTTSPIELTNGIEFLLKPFKKIGVPSHEIAMMMTITLRFIPILVEELDKIMKAQIARGAELDTGGLIKKAKALIPILVPLFLSSFRRAEDLATAMEARCYRGDVNRTSMKEMKLLKNDYISILILIILIIIIFLTMKK